RSRQNRVHILQGHRLARRSLCRRFELVHDHLQFSARRFRNFVESRLDLVSAAACASLCIRPRRKRQPRAACDQFVNQFDHGLRVHALPRHATHHSCRSFCLGQLSGPLRRIPHDSLLRLNDPCRQHRRQNCRPNPQNPRFAVRCHVAPCLCFSFAANSSNVPLVLCSGAACSASCTGTACASASGARAVRRATAEFLPQATLRSPFDSEQPSVGLRRAFDDWRSVFRPSPSSRCLVPSHSLRHVTFAFSALFAFGPVVPAQDAPAKNPPKEPSQKEQTKQRKKARKELTFDFTEFIQEDAKYIILKEELDAFKRLSTNEEREAFIEIFWQRRNPNPDSTVNEFREEHYRRIAYANEHFASGIPGWKTDRGHIYIVWGPPDEIDSHPTGGTYDRPAYEGGGSTTTYPW